ADAQRPDRGKDNRRREGPRPEGTAAKGPREGRPDSERPREERRGPRPPRREADGPALRLYATTEKKGETPADSPFAKLLELKLRGKKQPPWPTDACDAPRQVALACSLLQDPELSCTLHRDGALPHRRPRRRQAARGRGARHGIDLRVGIARARGPHPGIGRAPRPRTG